MTPRPHFLFTVLAVCCFVAIYAFPMDGFDTGVKCRCLKTSATFIHPRLFKRLEMIPLGAHCRQAEIIITMKDNKTVCVTPEAPWINKVIKTLMGKKRNRRPEGNY
ncbi:hypothetical protein AAFF_G00431880 [Aldrovandia affinis]|uniref:Chemokine interleukin-8-like domain-containing protein n=1 Tax=Aldrovandia affinis TaxID=143900 RepID=A0AAD7WIC3_9TELE|nr:hypothetical protein AAFF_G00431880 [Aldrovandia affinis]